MRAKNDQPVQEEGNKQRIAVDGLRYVNPHFTIPGVPARDLSAEEAAVYRTYIDEAQANSRVTIYEENF